MLQLFYEFLETVKVMDQIKKLKLGCNVGLSVHLTPINKLYKYCHA